MTERQKLIKKLDALWSEVVKKKAGYESEISGRKSKKAGGEYVLNSHHLVGKPCLALRYSLDNGICITKGEHAFGAHGSYTQRMNFEALVKSKRGSKVYENLNLLRNNKADLGLIEIYLKKESKKLQ